MGLWVTWSSGKCLSMAGGLEIDELKVSSNPKNSGILCFSSFAGSVWLISFLLHHLPLLCWLSKLPHCLSVLHKDHCNSSQIWIKLHCQVLTTPNTSPIWTNKTFLQLIGNFMNIKQNSEQNYPWLFLWQNQGSPYPLLQASSLLGFIMGRKRESETVIYLHSGVRLHKSLNLE